MLIKDKGLADIQYEGDQFKYLHYQDIEPTLQEIKELQAASTDGFNADRTRRHIGRIPEIEFLKHPEWMHDGNLLVKWLQSDEGRKYAVHKVDTGRSGHIIVK